MDLSQYKDIHYDSRKLEPGSIFVAIKGEKFDGHEFIVSAAQKGAKLVVVENAVIQASQKLKKLVEELKLKYPDTKITEVENTRKELAKLSHEFYGKPSKNLNLFGVTGTNGKTTVTHLLQSIFSSTGSNCAIIGTMGLKKQVSEDYLDLGSTTPQSKETHEIITSLVKEKFKNVAMEVSSHALEQYRVHKLNFKTSVVTNLTQDHLDYHLTMENYFKAKAKLFKQTEKFVVLNADDEYYARFKQAAEQQGLIGISISAEASEEADILAQNIKLNDGGLAYTLEIKESLVNKIEDLKLNKLEEKIKLKLGGTFNVYNSLFAIAVALTENIELERIIDSLAKISTVAGRFETIKEGDSPLCIVDYAHSPDGLKNVLEGARILVKQKQNSKLICLFGCGGDRDITKRPKMGRIAYDLADKVYVTSDNPRSEDPEQIIADILTGIPDTQKVEIISDRASAIAKSIKDASSDDVVVVAGKGHEDYQILGDETIHFDDREEVRKAFLTLH